MVRSLHPSLPERYPACAPRRRVLIALSWWEERLLAGVARYAREHDWALDCSMRLTQRLPLTARCDGIIAYTGIAAPCRDLIDFIRAANVPVVSTHADRNQLNAPTVAIPHEKVGAIGAEHLLGLNFEHFAFVEFDENPIETKRAAGFAAAVQAAGKSFRKLKAAEFRAALPTLPRPMGLMAANDVNAVDVIGHCLSAGAAVPEEFAVIGVDNSDVICGLSPVPLTSVICDYERQGYEAAALLDRLMDGAPIPQAPLLVPPSRVMVRRSTDTLAIADEGTARALRFLRTHFREPIRIKQLGVELRGGLRRVQARFRAETGLTMAQELARLRIEHAKTLLVDEKRKIETVALESGFANRFHFSQAFRRATGKTPKEFRADLAVTAAKI